MARTSKDNYHSLKPLTYLKFTRKLSDLYKWIKGNPTSSIFIYEIIALTLIYTGFIVGMGAGGLAGILTAVALPSTIAAYAITGWLLEPPIRLLGNIFKFAKNAISSLSKKSAHTSTSPKSGVSITVDHKALDQDEVPAPVPAAATATRRFFQKPLPASATAQQSYDGPKPHSP
jgi:hypothetical protein